MIWQIKVLELLLKKVETRNKNLFITSLMVHNEEKEVRYIDSGYSTHMTSQEELFMRIHNNYLRITYFLVGQI